MLPGVPRVLRVQLQLIRKRVFLSKHVLRRMAALHSSAACFHRRNPKHCIFGLLKSRMGSRASKKIMGSLGCTKFSVGTATINWGRLIGGLVLWLSGRVRVSADGASQIVFKDDVTIQMEDCFNFNCDQAEVA